MKFNIFKREKVTNSADLENMMVTLPLTKKDISLIEAIESADKFHNMHGYASDEHMVKCDDEEFSVKDMRKNWSKMKAENAEMGDKIKALEEHGVHENDDDDDKNCNEDEEEHEREEEKAGKDKEKEKDKDAAKKNKKKNEPSEEEMKKKKNADEAAAKAKKNADDLAAKKDAEGEAHFKKLQNAVLEAGDQGTREVVLNSDRVAKGKSLFGS